MGCCGAGSIPSIYKNQRFNVPLQSSPLRLPYKHKSPRISSLYNPIRNAVWRLAAGSIGLRMGGAPSTPRDGGARPRESAEYLLGYLSTVGGWATMSTAPAKFSVIYVMMHRQEIFRPFKHHPRFSELLENIYTMDSRKIDREWSVEKVLQVIINSCRFWRGEGMKMFTQLCFTYEQESQSEQFFIPYIWRLVLPICGFCFKDTAITFFSVDVSPDLDPENQPCNGEMANNYREVDVKDLS